MKKGIAQQKQIRITILAIALTALLLVGACAPAPTVEKKTVEIGAIWSMTGAAAATLHMTAMGWEDYIRYFNQQEGIPGVSVKLTWADDALQYSLFRSHYERFVERGIQAISAHEETGIMGLKERFAKDEVVVCGGEIGYEVLTYPTIAWLYLTHPTLAEGFAVVAQHFMENWQEERPPKLAFMGIDSPWGYDPIATGTEYAEGLGFEVLPMEVVPFVTLDATTQLLRLKSEGADFVYVQGLPVTVGPVLRDAERLGLLGQMRFGGHASAMGERVIEMTGTASEGFLVFRLTPWLSETEYPGIKLMVDNQMEYHGKVYRESEYDTGWVPAAVVCEAIGGAIENVGYENLDGLAIKEAMDSMKGFDIYGLATVTYNPDDHRGITRGAVYQVKDGKIVRVSDWQEVPKLVPEK